MPGVAPPMGGEGGTIGEGGTAGGGGGGGGGTGAGDTPVFIPPVTTVEQLAAILRRLISGIELPRALSRLSQLLKQSKDPSANHAGQQAISCATAAQNDLLGILNALYAVASYAEEAASTATAAGVTLAGSFSQAFSGVGGQEVDKAISDSSITVNAQGYCWYEAPGTDPYLASFHPWTLSVAAGTYTFRIRNNGAAPANSYPFRYIIVC